MAETEPSEIVQWLLWFIDSYPEASIVIGLTIVIAIVGIWGWSMAVGMIWTLQRCFELYAMFSGSLHIDSYRKVFQRNGSLVCLQAYNIRHLMKGEFTADWREREPTRREVEYYEHVVCQRRFSNWTGNVHSKRRPC